VTAVRETYPAIVMDNQDDEQRGRIKVACAALLGDEESELPMWVEPDYDWGWFYVPDVDEQVEIVVTTSSDMDEAYGQSSIDDLDVRWRNKRYYTDEDAEKPTPIHEDFLTNYGKRRGFATPNGHILFFDDTEGKEKIQLVWKQGGDKYQYLTMDETGSIVLANMNGSIVYLDAKNAAIMITDEHGNTYTTNEEGLKLIDKFSNIIEMKDGVVQVLSQGEIALMGGVLNAKVASYDLGDGADEPVMKGTTTQTHLDTHTHPTSMGPSGPPLQPLPPAALSTKGKVL